MAEVCVGPGALARPCWPRAVKHVTAYLGEITGRTVTDETGIVGDFDINLRLAPEPPRSPQAGTDAPPLFDASPRFEALREQLGLRLETRKGAVSMLVIDSVDRPTSD